mgnify:CR=1 FL=1
MSPLSPPLNYINGLNRYRFLTILNAANKCEEYQFTKQAAMLWLANFPGDLYVKHYQALTLAQLGKKDQAKSLLQEINELDPLFVEPVKALSELVSDETKQRHFAALAQYLTQENPPEEQPLPWLTPLWEARLAFSRGKYEQSTALVHQSLIHNPTSPIPGILHLRIARKMENQEMLNNLSEIYHTQWPKCLQINVIKALVEMEMGKETAAVERLHWVAANDSSGQVIQRLMGTEHRFQDLWPDRMEIYFDLPIPASVTALLGWNQLQSGQMYTPEFKNAVVSGASSADMVNDKTQEIRIRRENKSNEQTTEDVPVAEIKQEIKAEKEDLSKREVSSTTEQKDWATPEDFQEIQESFSRLAKRLKKPDLERSDNRFPVYVILTSKKQLESIYGPNTAEIIDDLLKKLVSMIQQLPEWGSLLFYPDDPAQMSQLGLKPTVATDAWQVKLSLSDLDASLAKRGEMIGALLIVGGPEIVPFHNLPNPTHDNDLEVPSDNPYGTIDENYFIPQWPVGRLPGETGPDAGLLLHQIRHLIFQYEKKSKNSKIGSFNFASIINWVLKLFANLGRQFDNKKSLGYSAEIWQEASADVFKTVGKTNGLQLSPPIHSGNFLLDQDKSQNLGYFNLHGVKDGPHWYGQKDFSSESTGPDYPIALSPAMFSEKIPSPKLVLTEACYGANVLKKQYEEALSLKFLDSGTTSFIGSTCIAYGSVTSPLVAADFLAEKFWQQILKGQPAGYALMQAKLSLAEEMTRLQGFLDGEDQKTILSFILFGDPLAVHDGIQTMPKPLFRIKSHPAVKTISDSDMEPSFDSAHMPKSVNKQVKKTVEKYLPGLENAQMHYNKSASLGDGKNSKSVETDRYVVTLQKSFDQNQHITHHHFARMTFDKKGKLVKFTTSR